MYKNLLRWRQAMLEGAKVRLRPVKDSDWDIYGAWNNDAEVSVGQNDLFMPFNADQLENLFKMWRVEDPASGFTCTIETLDGQVVGTISIYGIKSPVRLRYVRNNYRPWPPKPWLRPRGFANRIASSF